MTTRYNTWLLVHNVMMPSVTTSFSIEIMSIFQAIKSHLKQSYDKQNLTLVVISYISYEMTTSVRSSIDRGEKRRTIESKIPWKVKNSRLVLSNTDQH